MNRSSFLTTTALAATAAHVRAAESRSAPHIASNSYPWGTFANRTEVKWDDSTGLREQGITLAYHNDLTRRHFHA